MMRRFYQKWFVVLMMTILGCVVGSQLMDIWTIHQAAVKPQALAYKNFACPILEIDHENEEPINVHMIRPGDVGVIGALGDSITAGVGASSMASAPGITTRPSLSFSAGGEESLETVITLPNIFRKFNPEIYGASLTNDVRFNVAVGGARARDMPAQAKELIRRIASRPHLTDSWKLITIFIGINDICHGCYSDVEAYKTAPTPWINHIDRTISILSSSLSKTFINLVSVNSVYQLRIYEKYDELILRHCRCISSAYNYYKSADRINQKYQKLMYELIGKYDRSDFTVVVQPYLTLMNFPTLKDGPDLSFVSPDCFHYSRRWHAAAAIGLWNNMLQPIGRKSNKTNLSIISLSCPDQACPYLKTNVNSVNCTQSYLLAQPNVEPLFLPETPPRPKLQGATGRAALWIFLIFFIAALIGGIIFYWYRRKHRRGKMDLAQLSARHPSDDPQVPLVGSRDVRLQNAKSFYKDG